MPTATMNIVAEGGGVVIRGKVARTALTAPAYEQSLAVGKAGTLSTRTDDETGTLTLGGGHGITTGAIIDLYWSGGSRRTILVGTVSGTSVPIGADNAGVGDVLPAQSTAIVACVRTVLDVNIDGDNSSFILACLEVAEGSTGRGNISCEDAADDLIADVELTGNEPQPLHLSSTSLTNAFTGDPITQIHASNGSSTVAATLKIITAASATN